MRTEADRIIEAPADKRMPDEVKEMYPYITERVWNILSPRARYHMLRSAKVNDS